jgi:hypothetical protein
MTESLVARIASLQNRKLYQELHWEGSFDDYLDIVKKDPRVARTSFQRVHDMVVSYGRHEYIDSKKKVVHYPFFDDPIDSGKDAIFGLDIPLRGVVSDEHDLPTELTVSWVLPDGREVAAPPWGPGRPNGGDDQNCAALDRAADGLWNDNDCTEPLPYVCQRP